MSKFKMVHYELPALHYDIDDLEPYIDAKTMRYHQDYHRWHTDGLNKILVDMSGHVHRQYITSLLYDLKSVPAEFSSDFSFYAGGYENHKLFWECMSPDSGKKPKGEIGFAIDIYFDSFEKFQKIFVEKASAISGSGWQWLVYDQNFKRLELLSTPNESSPWIYNKIPILGCDVWEHAYYMQYDTRLEYIESWWNVINWELIDAKFSAM